MANSNRQIQIEKLTLNVGAGKSQDVLEKGVKLIQHISGVAPVKTYTTKRIPSWGLRPGLPIGCKCTLRNKELITNLIGSFLKSRSNTLKDSNFDDSGNVSFGIAEYINIPGVKYSPDIGIMGFQVTVTLKRPGYRIKHRRIMRKKIPHVHRVTHEDAIAYFKETFGVAIQEE